MNDLTRLQNKTDIIYDFDGTIAKVKLDWEIWHDGVEKIFQKYDPTFVRNGYVHPFQNVMVKKFGKNLRDEISKFNEQFEINYFTGIIPNLELIKFIKNNGNKRQYILSAQNHLLLDKLLSELEINGYFSKVIARDDVLYIKPNPEGMNLILQDSKVQNFLYLGDSLSDEQTANAVNMDFEYIKI